MELAASGVEAGGGGGGGGARGAGLGARRRVRLALRVAEGGAVLARVEARCTPSEAPSADGHGPAAFSASRREKPAYTEMISAALLHMEEEGCCTMALGHGGGVSAAALKKCAHPLAHHPLATLRPLASPLPPGWRASAPQRATMPPHASCPLYVEQVRRRARAR